MVAGLLLACDWHALARESRISQRSRDGFPRELYSLQHKNVVNSDCTKGRLAYAVRCQPTDPRMARLTRSYPHLAINLCFLRFYFCLKVRL